jgi:DNA-binding IclR family transcriptional regulator
LLRQDGFSDLEQDNLDALSKRFGVTAIGVEASGLDHMIVVAIARPAQPFRLHVDVGSRFPALISASGRCIAAFGAYDSRISSVDSGPCAGIAHPTGDPAQAGAAGT